MAILYITHQSSRARRPVQFRLQWQYYTSLTNHQEPEGLFSSDYSGYTIHHSPVIKSQKACSVPITVTVLYITHQSSRAGRPVQFRLQWQYYTSLTNHQEPEGLFSSDYSGYTIHHSPVIKSQKACSVPITVTVLYITHQSSRAGRPVQFRLQWQYYTSLTNHQESEGLFSPDYSGYTIHHSPVIKSQKACSLPITVTVLYITHQSSRAGRPVQFRLQWLYYTSLTSHQEPEGLFSSDYSDCTIHHSPVIKSRKACSVPITVAILYITHQSSRARRPVQFRLQ